MHCGYETQMQLIQMQLLLCLTHTEEVPVRSADLILPTELKGTGLTGAHPPPPPPGKGVQCARVPSRG